MLTIHAEIAAAGTHLVLVAGGPDTQVTEAAKRLRTLTPLFTRSQPPGALTVPLTWAAVVQLGTEFGHAWAPGPRLSAWIAEQISLRTGAHAPLGPRRVPDGLTPYPWQAEGAGMIAALRRVLITDEPGTGKTITTILGLVRAGIGDPEHGPDDALRLRGPALIVCPASVVDPWVEAFNTWAPHLRAVAWRGTPKHRHALAGTADVYVTSYDTARVDAPSKAKPGALLSLQAEALVVDECHLAKNPQALRSQAVRRIARDVDSRDGVIVALSGTPITHHPGDLWATLAVIEPHAWPSRERWVARYCRVLPGDYSDEILGLHPATEPEFRNTLLGQQRRVAKADVLTQLPPKVYSVRTVDLPPVWRKAYDDMEKQMLAELPDGQELSVMSMLAQLTRLSQIASAPADVTITDEVTAAGEPTQHVHVTLKDPSWKVDALLEILDERPGEPVVVFAPSRQLIRLAGARAEAAGLRVGYIVGGQTQKQRTQAVTAFQSGQLDLICVTTQAGGVGITLTAAKTAVFLQRPWALVDAIQAEDRCHRIGSEKHDSIEVIDVVARNTLDSRIRAVLRTRAGQLADLVGDPRIVAELLGGTSTSTTERKAS